jgi:phosphoglycolate phosphatase-like HAD superfamily hydrolase
MDLLLFDIDGTLLRGGGVGRRAMEAALSDEVGGSSSLAHVPFHGNTDPAIVAAGLAALGIEPTATRIASVLTRYLAITRAWLAEHNPFVALAGAVELVRALERKDAALGLGTGNIEDAAWLKVEAIGLAGAFRFGGFGSDHPERGELLRVGWHRGAALFAVHPERCRVLVIGDTLKDIAAARHIGAEVLAVATGGDSRESLAAERPDHLAGSLAEPGVLAFIERWLGR